MFLQTNGERLEQITMLLKALYIGWERVCNLFAQRCQISFTFYDPGPIVIVAILIVS
jgi:hypothetical protein